MRECPVFIMEELARPENESQREAERMRECHVFCMEELVKKNKKCPLFGMEELAREAERMRECPVFSMDN